MGEEEEEACTEEAEGVQLQVAVLDLEEQVKLQAWKTWNIIDNSEIWMVCQDVSILL